jgi:mannitol-1-phosphate 5-dehydrogenase
LGVLDVFQKEGLPVGGFKAEIHSNLPLGAGLSSSAALEVSTAMLLQKLFGLNLDRLTIAKLCRRAENEFVGVNCGLLDQVSSAFGKAGHAIFLDCRNETVETTPFPAGVELLITQCGVPHRLSGGEYNERRLQCFDAAARLGAKALRDVTSAQLEAGKAILPPLSYKRAAHIVGENERDEWVENVRAVDLTDYDQIIKEIASADIMATSIGANNLASVAPIIAKGLMLRWAIEGKQKPALDLLICENLMDANHFLHQLLIDALPPHFHALMEEKLGLVETSIGRMVPIITENMRGDNSLRVCVEEYDFLPVDAAAFKGPLPPYAHLVPFSPFGFYLERKLYLHNMGNAISAYLGMRKQFEFTWQAMEDLGTFLFVQNAMMETGCMLSKKYDIDYAAIQANIDDLLLRFKSKALGDTNARVGRDPLRKLAPQDRLVGAARECVKYGIPPVYICLGLASALQFFVLSETGDKRAAAQRTLVEVCKIDSSDALFALAMTFYDALDRDADESELLLLAQTQQKSMRGDLA